MQIRSMPSYQTATRLPLALASLGFAVLWTAGMYWWAGPQSTASTIILMVAGALAGVGWYWAMRGYFALLSRRSR